jgi:hypothetical protein
MITIEQLKAKQSEELRRLQTEIDIRNELPLEPYMVHTFGRFFPNVAYQINDLDEFTRIYNLFSVHEKMIDSKKSCRVLCHPEEYPEYNSDEYIQGEYDFKIVVDQGNGFLSVKLSFYVINEYSRKLKITCELMKEQYKFSANFERSSNRWNAYITRKSPNNILYSLSDGFISYQSGLSREPSYNAVYMFVVDDSVNVTVSQHIELIKQGLKL